MLKMISSLRLNCLLLPLLLCLSACQQDQGLIRQNKEMQAQIETLKSAVAALNDRLDKLQAGKQNQEPPVPASVVLKHQPQAGAKVAIIEFTDYQCPYCGRHNRETLSPLRENYLSKGVLHYEVQDFPLKFHPFAKPAAAAVHCAGEKHFWPMHDWVFNNQQALSQAGFIGQAQQLGLDTKQFEACLQDPNIAKAIDESFQYGRSLGVNSTPYFFIGKIEGNKITHVAVIRGAAKYARFEAELQKLL